MIEQLKQLIVATWDGDIISKDYRDELIKNGLADHYNGWNFLTYKGIEYLVNLGYLKK